MSLTAAEELNAAFSNSDADLKLELISSIKYHIKRENIDVCAFLCYTHPQYDAVEPLGQVLVKAVHSPNPQVSLNALGTLSHFIKRLSLQDPNLLASSCCLLIGPCIERLADVKDRVRILVTQMLCELWRVSPADTERKIKESGLVNTDPQIREKCLLTLHNLYESFAFRSFTPLLINLLQDHQDSVRNTAKHVVVEFFSNAPNHVKADLKRDLMRKHVGNQVMDFLLSKLDMVDIKPQITIPLKAIEVKDFEDSKSVNKGSINGSFAGSVTSTVIGSLAGSEMEFLDPEHITSGRDLEHIFMGMASAFEGKETEQNWNKREKHVARLRALTRGNAFTDFQTRWLSGIRALNEGIVKTVNSLRTTLCLAGLQLLKDLSIVGGPAIDLLADLWLDHLIRLSASTKKIASQAASVTVAVIITNVSFSTKALHHVTSACFDKNLQPRLYATTWLRVLMESHSSSKPLFERTSSVENIEQAIKRGLTDTAPGTRDGMRKTMGIYNNIWPERKDAFHRSLDVSTQRQLQKYDHSKTIGGSGLTNKKSVSLSHPVSKLGTHPTEPNSTTRSAHSQPDNTKKAIDSNVSSRPSGLGLPQRQQLRNRPKSPSHLSHVSPTSNSHSDSHRIPSVSGSPSEKGSILKHTSPNRNGSVSLNNRQPSGRRLSILEQLLSTDWKIRVEGVVTVACVLAKKVPPHYAGPKLPTIPPSDVLGPTLEKLLNDPQTEVLQHIVAPEVIAEMTKIIPLENIVPRLLLLSECDEEDIANDVKAAGLPTVKRMMSEEQAAELLFNTLTTMGVSRVIPRKLSSLLLTTPEKRRVIHGTLLWMNELVLNHISESQAGRNGNNFFTEVASYKLYVNRLIPMINNTRNTSINYIPLALLLKNLRCIHQALFDKVLQTFERSIIVDLKKAWGMNEEDTQDIVPEEKVANVVEVLGSAPEVGGKTVVSQDYNSPHHSLKQLPTSNGDTRNGTMQPPPDIPQHVDPNEDITMIALPSLNRISEGLEPPSSGDLKKNSESQRQSGYPLETDSSTQPNPSAQDQNGLSLPPKLPKTSHAGTESPINAPEDVKSPQLHEIPPKTDIIPLSSNGAIASEQFKSNNYWYNRQMARSTLDPPLSQDFDSKAVIQKLIEQFSKGEIGMDLMKMISTYLKQADTEEQDLSLLHGFGDEATCRSFVKAMVAFLPASPKQTQDEILLAQCLLVMKQVLVRITFDWERLDAEQLTGLLKYREFVQNAHLAVGVEEIVHEIIDLGDVESCAKAVLDYAFESLAADDVNKPALLLALIAGAHSLRRMGRGTPESLESRYGQLAVQTINNKYSEVRRASVGLCVELHAVVRNDDRLLNNILGKLTAGQKNLLTYYFAKRDSGT